MVRNIIVAKLEECRDRTRERMRGEERGRAMARGKDKLQQTQTGLKCCLISIKQ